MRTLNRWKRRYRKTKKAASSFKGWFSANPMQVQTKKPARKGAWDRVSLKQSRTLPEPTWKESGTGQLIYGPVRKGSSGWAYYDEKGNEVYSKQTKARMSTRDIPVTTGNRDTNDWDFSKPYDAKGAPIEITRPTKRTSTYPTSKPKRPTKCGKRRADGKKCRFKGDCPHHRNKMM